MKRLSKAVSGVTLLEIMLVLAIAAMLIVMSVRYYNSSTQSQQANAVLGQLQAIASAVNDVSGGQAYAASTLSTSTVTGVLPTGAMDTPWGGTITIGAVTATTYVVNVLLTPEAVCKLIAARLSKTKNYAVNACGTGTQTLTYTYDATK